MATEVVENIISEKIGKLREFRQRYSKQKYPEKVAINIVYMALGNGGILKKKDEWFQGGQPNMEAALKAGETARQQINKRIAQDVKPKYRRGGEIRTLNVDQMKSLVSKAERKSNEAVSQLEFGYLFFAGMYDCIFLWTVRGLAGVDRQQAFADVIGGFTEKSNFGDPGKIEGAFYTVMRQLGVPDPPLPPLW